MEENQNYYMEQDIDDTGVSEVQNPSRPPVFESAEYDPFKVPIRRGEYVGEYFHNDSRYDPTLGNIQRAVEVDGLSVDDLRYDQQNNASRLANALVNNLAIAGTTAVQGTLGTVYGLLAAAAQGEWSKIWDNDVNNAMADVQKAADEWAPVYRGELYQNKSMWQKLGNGVFWSDFIKNLGYTEGMLIPGTAMSSVLSKAPQVVRMLIPSLVGSFGEATAEAVNNKNEQLDYAYRVGAEEYQKKAEQLKDNPEALAQLNAQFKQDMANVEVDAVKAGNAVQLGNVALLTASNIIQWGKLFSKGFGTQRKAFGQQIKGLKKRYGISKDNTVVDNLGRAVKEPVKDFVTNRSTRRVVAGAIGRKFKDALTEGLEEVNQGIIAGATTHTESYNRFNASQFNPDAVAQTQNIWSALGLGLAEALGDKATAEEFMMGALTGFLGAPGFVKGRPTWQNSVFQEVKEAIKQRQGNQEVVNFINNQLSNLPKTQAFLKGLVTQNALQNDMNNYVEQGDEFNYQNAANAELFNSVQMYAKAGMLDTLRNVVNNSIDMSDEGIAALIQETSKDGNGPFMTNGVAMPVVKVREAIQKKQQQYNQAIDDYIADYEELSAKFPEADESTMDNILFLKHMRRQLGGRENEMGNELVNNFKFIYRNLTKKQREKLSPEALELLKSGAGWKEVLAAEAETLIKRLEKEQKKKKDGEEVVEDEEQEKSPFNQIWEAIRTADNITEDVKNTIATKIKDLNKIREALRQNTQETNNLLQNPYRSMEEYNALKQEALQREIDANKETMKGFATQKDLRRFLNEESKSKEAALQQLAEEGNQLAVDYNKIQGRFDAFVEAIDADELSPNDKRVLKAVLAARLLDSDSFEDFSDLSKLFSGDNVKELLKDVDDRYKADMLRALQSFDQQIKKKEQESQKAVVPPPVRKPVNSDSATTTSTVDSTELEESDDDDLFGSETGEAPSDSKTTAAEGHDPGGIVPPVKPKKPKGPKPSGTGGAVVAVEETKREETSTEEYSEGDDTISDKPVSIEEENQRVNEALAENDRVQRVEHPEEEAIEESAEDTTDNTEQANYGEDIDSFYIRAIPEIAYPDLKAGKFISYPEHKDPMSIKDPNAKYQKIWQYFVDKGTFVYLNEGNLHVGDEIVYGIDPELNELVRSQMKDKYPGPIIVMFKKKPDGTYQVLGSLPTTSRQANRFKGLTALTKRIRDEYNKQENKDEIFISSYKTTVKDVLPGRIQVSKEKTIPLDEMESVDPDSIIFGVGSLNKGITTNKLEQEEIIELQSPGQTRGRVYWMLPNGAGKYVPMSLRHIHLNELPMSTPDRSNPISDKIMKYLNELSKLEIDRSKESVAKAREIFKKLKNYLLLSGFMIDTFAWEDGKTREIKVKGIKIYRVEVVNGKPIVDKDGHYTRVRNEDGSYDEQRIYYTKPTEQQWQQYQQTKAATGRGSMEGEVAVKTQQELLQELGGFISKLNPLIRVNREWVNSKNDEGENYNIMLLRSKIFSTNIVDPMPKGTTFIVHPFENESTEPTLNEAITNSKSPVGGSETTISETKETPTEELTFAEEDPFESEIPQQDNTNNQANISESGNTTNEETKDQGFQNFINEDWQGEADEYGEADPDAADDDSILRQTVQGEYNKWDQAKEMEWLNRVLPQLSVEDRIRVIDGLIEVGKQGATAWGMVSNGIMTLSNVAAEGTTYHEAFHIVFRYLLDEKRQKAILSEARRRYGDKTDKLLEDELAEEFRDYVMTREVPRGLTAKIIHFFKQLLAKVTHWEQIRPYTNALFRQINGGGFRNQKLTIRPYSAWHNLNAESQSKLEEQDMTNEKFDSLSKEEQDYILHCYA